MDVSANELRITDYLNVKNLQVSIKKISLILNKNIQSLWKYFI